MTTAFTPETEGIFFDLPEEIYRSAPGEAQSDLKKILRSPSHYRNHMDEPQKPAAPDQIFGQLLHLAVLEPDRLAGSYVVKPDDIDYRTNAGKAWRSAQIVHVIGSEEEECLRRATTKAASCVINTESGLTLGNMIACGRKEVSVFKYHSETGLLMKGRLDCVVTDKSGLTFVVDIKTTDDASEDGFIRQIGKWNYAFQAAYYMDLIGASHFWFGAVEKSGPCEVAAYEFDREGLELGRAQYSRAIQILADCKMTDRWPGYGSGVKQISAPRWQKFKEAA